MIRRPPRSTRTDTLCPYTTLFRSVLENSQPVESGVLVREHQMMPADPELVLLYGEWHDQPSRGQVFSRQEIAFQGETKAFDRGIESEECAIEPKVVGFGSAHDAIGPQPHRPGDDAAL